MSLGTWEPDTEKSHTISSDLDLSPFIQTGRHSDLNERIRTLPADTIKQLMPLMKQEHSFWLSAAEKLERDDIIALIRFFTIAEEQHSELFAGNHSPVIALNKLLKQRKQPLDKTLLLWIKENSSNRFLPNGSVL